MRVAPPTITTPLMSSTVRPASRSALRVGPSVFCTRFCVIWQNFSVVRHRSTHSPEDSLSLSCASP